MLSAWISTLRQCPSGQLREIMFQMLTEYTNIWKISTQYLLKNGRCEKMYTPTLNLVPGTNLISKSWTKKTDTTTPLWVSIPNPYPPTPPCTRLKFGWNFKLFSKLLTFERKLLHRKIVLIPNIILNIH